MVLIEVTNKQLAEEFIKVNVLMNKHNPHYIRPMDNEVHEVFDKNKNHSFKHGEIIRWILKDENGIFLGRIAAFTNTKYINKGTDYPTGAIGFFDCINNQVAANILFDKARQWLWEKGMDAMDGPINFGSRDKWWGLLVDGFDREPAYGIAFNPNYYQSLFETYGFKNYYFQYYFLMIVARPLDPRFASRYEKLKKNPDYDARHLTKDKLEKYAQDFATVYNAAWSQHDAEKEITKEQVMQLFKKMKPIIDERIIWFAYYKEQPIAMWVNIPDLNQYFKHFNGKFGLLEKLRFLYMQKTGQCKKFTGIAYGVVPKFQGMGIDSYMIYESSLIIQGKHIYDELEAGWSGDWNPKMLAVYKSLNAEVSRTLITYRYIFNDKHVFERHPVLEYNR